MTRSPPSSADDGVEIMRLLDAIYESARIGARWRCAMSISPLPEGQAGSAHVTHARISRFAPACAGAWQIQGRPHRHRHIRHFRRAGEVRSARIISAAHHQEAPHQIDHLRVALVSARRYQCALAAGARRDDLGRMGRRTGESRSRLWRPMVRLARRRRAQHQPDRRSHRRRSKKIPTPAGTS